MPNLPSREEEQAIWAYAAELPESSQSKEHIETLLSALDAIREALGMPEASVEEILARIVSMQVTIDMLSDNDLVRSLVDGVNDIKAGRTVSLDNLRRELKHGDWNQ